MLFSSGSRQLNLLSFGKNLSVQYGLTQTVPEPACEIESNELATGFCHPTAGSF